MKYAMEELLPILQELTEKYTGKESTSVTYEKAQQLLGAVIYCIRESTGGKSAFKKETGIRQNSSAKEAYELGCRMLREKVERTSQIYAKQMENFESYGSKVYQDTVEKAIPLFFQQYDIRFCPQNHIITLDYPLVYSLENLQGADRIAEYLECIWIEQAFLQKFPQGYVRNVLEQYHGDYQELIINVSEIVMKRVLMDMLMDKTPSWERRKQEEYDRITKLVAKEEREALENRLRVMLNILTEQICPGQQQVYRYLVPAVADFAVELKNGAEYGEYPAI